MDAESHINKIKIKLALSAAVQSIEVIDERVVLSNRGYFRARLKLSNGDFLEVSEYFVFEKESYVLKQYRYQWMDNKQKVLKKRWDNAEHFQNLPNFPNHTHIGNDESVEPSEPISILELIDIIEKELSYSTESK